MQVKAPKVRIEFYVEAYRKFSLSHKRSCQKLVRKFTGGTQSKVFASILITARTHTTLSVSLLYTRSRLMLVNLQYLSNNFHKFVNSFLYKKNFTFRF